jgi:hypothetical protein
MKRGGNRGEADKGQLAIHRYVDDLPWSSMNRGGNRDIGRFAIYRYVEGLPWSCMKRGGNRGYRQVIYIPVCRRLTMELHEERRKQGIWEG